MNTCPTEKRQSWHHLPAHLPPSAVTAGEVSEAAVESGAKNCAYSRSAIVVQLSGFNSCNDLQIHRHTNRIHAGDNSTVRYVAQLHSVFQIIVATTCNGNVTRLRRNKFPCTCVVTHSEGNVTLKTRRTHLNINQESVTTFNIFVTTTHVLSYFPSISLDIHSSALKPLCVLQDSNVGVQPLLRLLSHLRLATVFIF